MEETTLQTNTPVNETTTPVVAVEAEVKPRNEGGREDRGRGRGKNSRRPQRREARSKPEFDQKIVSLRRVTRVTSGGRRFAFSVCVVAGNHRGMVGVGQGKAGDTPLAIEKAFRDAKKNMITINTTKNMSIPHEIEAKHASSVVKIMPAPGKGILAGSSVRTVIELAGLREISAKLQSRSKNKINNAYVAVKALEKLKHTKIKNK